MLRLPHSPELRFRYAPLEVKFTDSSTGSSITNRRWDFGDGNVSNYAVSTNPVHRYTSAGTYTVNLTVTNAGGSDSLKRINYITITASPVAPVAAFTGTPLTGTAPLEVKFTDSSTGSSITSRRWDFGDGNVSNYAVSTNPVHRYTSAGTYTVNLTVTNAGGSDSLKHTNFIIIAAPEKIQWRVRSVHIIMVSGTWTGMEMVYGSLALTRPICGEPQGISR